MTDQTDRLIEKQSKNKAENYEREHYQATYTTRYMERNQST